MPKLKSSKKKFENPIIEIYKGHPIRKYNYILLRVTESTKKKLIDAKLDLNISHKDAIAQNKVHLR